MAMDETQVAATELENVRKKIPILFDKEDTFYSQIEKGEVEQISNRDMRIPLELRPGGRFGHFDPAGGDLGRGEGPTYEKAVINTVHLRHAIEWHKKTEWATDSARKAVVQSVKKLLRRAWSSSVGLSMRWQFPRTGRALSGTVLALSDRRWQGHAHVQLGRLRRALDAPRSDGVAL